MEAPATVTHPASSKAVPFRWRLAGWLRRIPEFRGRDRLGGIILRGATPPAGVVRCLVGPNLLYDARMQEDGSWVDLFFLQYESPALTPILETFLRPGSTFVDVGANIGVYAGWAARLVGTGGQVLAFEPVPATREYLEHVVALNHLDNLHVIPKALGAQSGTVTLWVLPRASGLTTSLPPTAGSAAQPVDVPLTTLDDELAAQVAARGGPPPALVKIDVEGLEIAVLKGAARTLAGPTPPAVVFETHGPYLVRAGVDFGELPGWFEDQFGFHLFGMLPAGLRRIARGTPAPPAHNCLALHPEHHRTELETLSRMRFRRNQSC